MLDIKIIRENPDAVRLGLTNRGGKALPEFEKVLHKDTEWRGVITTLENLRARRNAAADEIGKIKREKGDASDLLRQMESVKAEMKALEDSERAIKLELDGLLLNLPNLPDASVPVGASAENNKVVREHGTKTSFTFKAKDHHELGTTLGLLDFEAGTALSGARFTVFSGWGARLERSIANFMLDLHTKEHGYQEKAVPHLVTRETMTATGQLPKFEEELYKASDDLFLIPTSEVALANLMRDKAIDETQLPVAVTAHTPCFRREAGAAGKDTRGLIRNHQFDKVELVRFCRIEDSLAELEKITSHAEEVLKRLELPYRVLALCTGDMGFSSAKTYDLEVWMPGDNVYREISSCSTCSDFQARRMNFKVMTKDKKRVVGCTLNGSGLAVGRTFAAILENYQDADGGVRIPKALQPYMGADRIAPSARA